MNSNQLIRVIDFWNKSVEKNDLFPRDLTFKVDVISREIIDIVGPRRSGKSSLLKLLIRNRLTKSHFLFINFEDPFFIEHKDPMIIEHLIDTSREYFSKDLKYLFFDEIQNIVQWEKSIRKLRDGTDYKIFLSGSSSKLMSRELSSLLTGRHLSYELTPFSFTEYLVANGLDHVDKKVFSLQEAQIIRLFGDYLKLGGFPEIVKTKNEELLKQYYFDIIDRDIIRRYDIRQKDVLEKMGLFLISNTAKIISVASLKRTWNISYDLASAYLEYFKDAFLIYEVTQFSYSLKSQTRASKKYYCTDTGMANTVSFRFSDDYGRLLENCVFLHLRRRAQEIYYYRTKGNHEVDFLIKSNKEPLQLIQVSYQLYDENTRIREIRALTEAMDELELKEGLILTQDTRDILKIDNKTIHIKPVYEWMLDL
ncbi:MAG: ATP-binding protein [Bacteroidales bacterium]|nr:ATP-binding protein [Bacteroidales bacterium]